MNLISAKNLQKIYQPGRLAVEALRGVNLDIAPGAFAVLLGPSGGGKTTLLNLLGGLSRPTSGSLVVCGVDLAQANAADLNRFRRSQVGFVFQFFNLLPSQTALDNVALAMLARGLGWTSARREAQQALERLGLASRLGHRPGELSGGEQQRVAIARALVGRPTLLLADEPTGNLDSENAAEIMRLLAALREDFHLTCILATHNPEFSRLATQVIELRDGLIQPPRSTRP